MTEQFLQEQVEASLVLSWTSWSLRSSVNDIILQASEAPKSKRSLANAFLCPGSLAQLGKAV